MNAKILKSIRLLILMLVVSGMMAAPSFAKTYYLIAKPVDVSMPDGEIIPMWGFAEDPGGNCFRTTPISARRISPDCLNPVAMVPGPRLNLGTDLNLSINVTNLLPNDPVSLIIPGQEMPYSAANNGPTWVGGGRGPRPGAGARVRSFGREAGPDGGRQLYRWTTTRNNPFQTGTYIYHSGTHPQVQVQMGLYGAVTRDAIPGFEAYAGIPFDEERDLFFSEIDPVLHASVAGGTFSGSTLDYHPKYFLINGQPFNSLLPDPCLNSTGLDQGDRILLRLYNAGLREFAPMMIGSHFDMVAEAGKAYPFKRTQYQTLLVPGSTKDVIVTPGYDGTFNIIDRRLNLTNDMATGGGFQTCFTVAAVP
jgi:FtsP/CotA-like multicopper oxidase with cupredoxin domain